jgi:heat shock protein HslJ
MLRLSIIVLLLALLGSAAPAVTAEVDAGKPAVLDPLHGSEWRLANLPGRNLAQVPERRRPTLAFAEGRMRGRGLCNILTASYTFGAPGEVRLGRVGAGRVPCTDVEFLEEHLIRQLEDVTGYRIEGERLVLITRRGRELAFDRLPANPGSASGR